MEQSNLLNFRALKKGSKIPVWGFLGYDPTETDFFITEINEIPPSWTNPSGDVESKRHEIDSNTICRGTGKTDKKNNPVYEYDILRQTIEYDEGDEVLYYVVVWIKEYAMFSTLSIAEFEKYKENGFESIDEPMYWTYHIENIQDEEIIGNAFDGKEYGHNKVNLLEIIKG